MSKYILVYLVNVTRYIVIICIRYSTSRLDGCIWWTCMPVAACLEKCIHILMPRVIFAYQSDGERFRSQWTIFKRTFYQDCLASPRRGESFRERNWKWQRVRCFNSSLYWSTIYRYWTTFLFICVQLTTISDAGQPAPSLRSNMSSIFSEQCLN